MALLKEETERGEFDWEDELRIRVVCEFKCGVFDRQLAVGADLSSLPSDLCWPQQGPEEDLFTAHKFFNHYPKSVWTNLKAPPQKWPRNPRNYKRRRSPQNVSTKVSRCA